jgi:hypothetical protein
MATDYKVYTLATQLADKLKARVSSKTVTLLFDTDSNPYITINDGTPATTEDNWVIKIVPQSAPLAKDALGNTAIQYTPSVCQLVTEAPAAGTGVGVYVQFATLGPILMECFRLGTAIEWYQSANGVVPTTAAITGTPKVSVQPSFYWPVIANQ